MSKSENEGTHKSVMVMLLCLLPLFACISVLNGSLFLMFITGFVFTVLLEEMMQLTKFKYRGEYRGMNDEAE